jgi:hypothetical protein
MSLTKEQLAVIDRACAHAVEDAQALRALPGYDFAYPARLLEQASEALAELYQAFSSGVPLKG